MWHCSTAQSQAGAGVALSGSPVAAFSLIDTLLGVVAVALVGVVAVALVLAVVLLLVVEAVA